MISKILLWGGGGLAAFFGLSWLAARGAVNNADAAQQQAAQPSLPMFVSSGFGGGFGGGGFGGGSGITPALPQAEFPAIPASTFNFPEIPGTNENDVAIADYNFRAKQAAFKHEENLAKWTFDILKFGVENPAVNNSPNPAGDLVGGQLYPVGPEPASRLPAKYGQQQYTSPQPPAGYNNSGVVDYKGPSIFSNGGTNRAVTNLSPDSVKSLFNTMSSNQAEYELYRRAQQAGADNRQIADVLNKSGIAPTRVFSALDVENWKYERGL